MRTIPALSLVLLGAACASSGSTAASAPPSTTARAPVTETLRIEGGGTFGTSVTTATTTKTLPFSIDQVWRVLPAVYDSLGIPVATLDAASHTVGNDGFKTRFRLRKVSLSRYLDCGSSPAGPSADDYEVTMAVHTQLAPGAASSTTATTTLEASAKPVQFSQPPTRCSSRGVLEPRVGDLIATLLAAGVKR